MVKNGGLILGVVFFLLLGTALFSLGSLLFPFFAGLIGAYILDPIVSFLQKLGIPRGIGASLIVVLLIIIIGLLLVFVIPLLHNELIKLTINLPILMKKLTDRVTPFINIAANKLTTEDLNQIKSQFTQQLGGVVSWMARVVIDLFSNGMLLANALSITLLTPIVTFYLLKDWGKLVTNINSMLPTKYANSIRQNIADMHASLSAYAKGQSLVCIILICLYTIGLSIIGLKYSIIVGVFTGILSFVPYVGALVGFIASLVISFDQMASWNDFLLILIVFAVIQFVEGYLLSPNLVGEQIGLHPVWMLFALIASVSWFGFIGIFFAIPTAAVINVVVRAGKQWYIRKYASAENN